MPVTAKTWAIAAGVILLTAIIAAGIYGWAIAWHYHLTTAAIPPPYHPGNGWGVAYCRKLGEVARKGSTFDTEQAWLAAVLGLCLAIIGNVLDPKTPAPGDAKPPCVRNRGVLVMNLGVLLLVVSHFAFSRADSASMAASAVADAQADAARPEATGPSETGDRDRTAYITCLRIRGAWLKSRVDSNALVQSQIAYVNGNLGRRSEPLSATRTATSTTPDPPERP